MKEFDPGAKGGEDCCDEIYPDDGRIDNSNEEYDYGGDWGSHSNADYISENVDYSETA